MNDYSIGYTIEDENNVPPELTEAKAQGANFQVTSLVGWIDLEPEDLTRFRHSCTYRFRKDDYGFLEKGVHRLKGDESVAIDGKMYWAPKGLLDEFERLNTTIEKMQTDTSIMYAILNSSMHEDERAALTYQSGPYDITKLTVGIRDFVKVLIQQSRDLTEKEHHA